MKVLEAARSRNPVAFRIHAASDSLVDVVALHSFAGKTISELKIITNGDKTVLTLNY